jgi:hypothetical protein
MPHERPVIGANAHRNLTKKALYRMTSGAGVSMPSDTAFQRMPEKVEMKKPARPVREAVKVPRSEQPSFNSRSNLWYDPNNSFSNGRKSTGSGMVGKGRWETTKQSSIGG